MRRSPLISRDPSLLLAMLVLLTMAFVVAAIVRGETTPPGRGAAVVAPVAVSE